jgi:hypothetical protein
VVVIRHSEKDHTQTEINSSYPTQLLAHQDRQIPTVVVVDALAKNSLRVEDEWLGAKEQETWRLSQVFISSADQSYFCQFISLLIETDVISICPDGTCEFFEWL